MPYPSVYTIAYNYTGFQQSQGNNAFPGTQIDADLAGLQASTSSLALFTQKVMRADGALNNGVITFDSLSPGLQTAGIVPAVAWTTATSFFLGNAVTTNSSLYRCLIPHTSGVFATDLAAGKWAFVVALQMPALTGDVTSLAGSPATTIANNAVTNAKAAQMAAKTIKGNSTAGLANASDLTGDTVEQMLLYTQTGSGAVQRGVDSRLKDYISVLDFAGVDPTGTTDSMAGIVAADAAAAAAGKALRFPGGNYRVSGTITPSANAHWIGDLSGLTSFYMISTTATLFNVSNAGVELEHFRCLPVTTRTNTAITFAISSNSFYIHDVATFFNGISFSLSGSTIIGILDRVSTSSTVLNGIDLDVSNSFLVSVLNSTFTGIPGGPRAFAHVALRNVEGQIQLLNCNMFQANQGIVVMPGNGQVVTLVKADTTYVDSNPSGALAITPTGTGIVQRFSFVNGWLMGSPIFGASITGGGSTTVDEIGIHNTEILAGAGTGVIATGATRLQLLHNRFTNGANGISLSGVVGAHITGNIVTGAAGNGIALSGATDFADIHDNDVRGATTKVTNSATGTHNVIHDNIGYNPVGVAAITVGASPFTYTAGPSPETIYVNAGTVGLIETATAGSFVGVLQSTNHAIYLGPNEQLRVTYTAAPSMVKSIH
jgi:hypothetical protein